MLELVREAAREITDGRIRLRAGSGNSSPPKRPRPTPPPGVRNSARRPSNIDVSTARRRRSVSRSRMFPPTSCRVARSRSMKRCLAPRRSAASTKAKNFRCRDAPNRRNSARSKSSTATALKCRRQAKANHSLPNWLLGALERNPKKLIDFFEQNLLRRFDFGAISYRPNDFIRSESALSAAEQVPSRPCSPMRVGSGQWINNRFRKIWEPRVSRSATSRNGV